MRRKLSSKRKYFGFSATVFGALLRNVVYNVFSIPIQHVINITIRTSSSHIHCEKRISDDQ